MKLKLRMLLAFVFGICSFAALSVGVMGSNPNPHTNIDSGSESGSSSWSGENDGTTSDADGYERNVSYCGVGSDSSSDESSEASHSGSRSDTSWDKEMYERVFGKLGEKEENSHDSRSNTPDCSDESCEVAHCGSRSSWSGYFSSDFEFGSDSESFGGEFISYRELPSCEENNLGTVSAEIDFVSTGETSLCANFEELTRRLRAKQQKFGFGHVDGVNRPEGEDGWTQDESEYVYWVNTKLPTDRVNLYNKWFGENLQRSQGRLPNGVAVLLPTAFALRGKSYKTTEMRNIILNESNWELRRGIQSTSTGICQEEGARCSTFESYVAYLRISGISII